MKIKVEYWKITGKYYSTEEIDGIDNFWDWIIYNVFWIVHPIKAIFKFFGKILSKN